MMRPRAIIRNQGNGFTVVGLLVAGRGRNFVARRCANEQAEFNSPLATL